MDEGKNIKHEALKFLHTASKYVANHFAFVVASHMMPRPS